MVRFKLHRVVDGEDKVVGTFEIRDNKIVYASHADQHHCDMFPPGDISEYTKNRINNLLDNKQRTTYLEKVK